MKKIKMEIISKFVIGSDQGIDELFELKKAYIRHSYSRAVSSELIENYIRENFDRRKMINILNDFSNQVIMVYADQQPAGYCFFKSGSSYREDTEQKMTEITELIILSEYDLPEIKKSLWNKVKTAIQFTENIWINLYDLDKQIPFLEENKFLLVKKAVSEPFSLPSSVYELTINKE
nr:hypothetical protein [uncultured Chryseobacterium sp.]